MISGGLLDEPIFSFRIGPSEQDGGEVVFGGIDPTHYTGDIEYFPVSKKGYWEIQLQRVTLGNVVGITLVSQQVIMSDVEFATIDTGTEECRRSSGHWNFPHYGSGQLCRSAEHPVRMPIVVCTQYANNYPHAGLVRRRIGMGNTS
jgi:Eukaryotic aspartyl protease